MEINHILKLEEGGFNVPIYVLNPHKKYGGEICSTLREYVFAPFTKVTLLVDMKKGVKQFCSLQVQEASLIAMAMEKKGYRTMILEQPSAEFFGRAWFEPAKFRELPGGISIDTGKGSPAICKFAFVENIQGDLRLRSVARLVLTVQGYLDMPFVEVDYSWCVNFVGVNQLKLIVYDYRYFHIPLDKRP